MSTSEPTEAPDAPDAPETPEGLPKARVVRGGAPLPAWLIPALLVPPGWIYILIMNRWHVTASVSLMLLCWTALVLTGYWGTRMAVTSVDEGDADWFRVRGRRDDLEREKKSLLKAIKEIEFDRETGKMLDADAHELIATYRGRAIEVIKALEELDTVDGQGGLVGLSARERVLAELRARQTLDAKAKAGKKAKKGKAAAKAGDAS